MAANEEKKTRKFRITIRAKTIIMILLFGLVLAETAMVHFSLVSSNANKENYKGLATDISATVAATIDKTLTKEVTDSVVEIYNSSDKLFRDENEGTPAHDAYLASFDSVRQSQNYLTLQSELKAVKDSTRNTFGVYLGWVDFDRKACVFVCYDSESEAFPIGVVDHLYEEDYPLLEDHDLGFVASIYHSERDGEILVTAGSPVYDADHNIICYALVDISMAAVRSNQANAIVRLFIYLIASVILLSFIGIFVVHFTLVKPVKTLQKATKTYDASRPEANHEAFSKLKVNVNDELADLAENMKEMEADIYNKFNELVRINEELAASQRETERMTELANTDALTGVRSKIAYIKDTDIMNQKIREHEACEFGIAMIDLNYLKETNDKFGHDKGDAALIELCRIIKATFKDAPVYRVGGDEFVVVLKDETYANIDSLVEQFNSSVICGEPNEAEIEKNHISAAIGYSLYDSVKDACVDDVFVRADKSMYARKHEMKGIH